MAPPAAWAAWAVWTSKSSHPTCLTKNPRASGDFFWFNAKCRGRRRHTAASADVAAQSLRCPPSLLRQVLRVRCGRPLRGVSYVACGRSLVRNSPRGWAPKTLPNREARVGRAKARGGIAGKHAETSATKVLGNRIPATASASPGCSGRGRRRRRHDTTALLPADRIVVRDLGVHPRGEFRTSERP